MKIIFLIPHQGVVFEKEGKKSARKTKYSKSKLEERRRKYLLKSMNIEIKK